MVSLRLNSPGRWSLTSFCLAAATIGGLDLIGRLPAPIVIDIPAIEHDIAAFAGSKMELQPAGVVPNRFVHTLARPLFNPSRRPFEARAKPAKSAKAAISSAPKINEAVPISALDLRGVVVTETVRRAFIISPKQAQGHWHSVGAIIGGWTLQAVDRESAILKSDTGSIELKIFDFDNSRKKEK